MTQRRIATFLALLLVMMGSVFSVGAAEFPTVFRAGFAQVEITPTVPVPLWGYGKAHRPENISTGIHDPLFAKVLVLEADESRVALVGLDLGRPPFEPTVRRIQTRVRQRANIDHVLLVASHTHHGPALELVPVGEESDPALDNAFAYYKELEGKLVDVIGAAAENLAEAQIGWVSGKTQVNRNRHTKEAPIPRDDELFVLRVDGLSGEPIATLVNMAAHPTNHPHGNNQFSADFPGVMMAAVEKETGAPCLFLQGAAGDMQCDVDDSQWGKVDQMVAPGEALAAEVLALHANLRTAVPKIPDVRGMENTFSFPLRLDLTDPATSEGMRAGFGDALYESYRGKYGAGVMHPKLTTVLLNGELAFVGASGEFFSDLSVQLKTRTTEAKAVFLGYCNGHDMYFPTERAIAQGGYGAEPSSAWVTPGGPEQMMARAVYNIAELHRTFARDRLPTEQPAP